MLLKNVPKKKLSSEFYWDAGKNLPEDIQKKILSNAKRKPIKLVLIEILCVVFYIILINFDAFTFKASILWFSLIMIIPTLITILQILSAVQTTINNFAWRIGTITEYHSSKDVKIRTKHGVRTISDAAYMAVDEQVLPYTKYMNVGDSVIVVMPKFNGAILDVDGQVFKNKRKYNLRETD